EQINALSSYGSSLGVAFQIWDDILDIEGHTEVMGKEGGKDFQLGKVTYPSVLGIDRAKKEAYRYIEKGIEAIKDFGREADPLRAIARYVTERRR
ncbi:MAG: polyprenyl synthetase family protein, partial [Desulfatiglandales bacterium]